MVLCIGVFVCVSCVCLVNVLLIISRFGFVGLSYVCVLLVVICVSVSVSVCLCVVL